MYRRKVLMGCLYALLVVGVILAIVCTMMGCASEPKEGIRVVRERVCFDDGPGQ